MLIFKKRYVCGETVSNFKLEVTALHLSLLHLISLNSLNLKWQTVRGARKHVIFIVHIFTFIVDLHFHNSSKLAIVPILGRKVERLFSECLKNEKARQFKITVKHNV